MVTVAWAGGQSVGQDRRSGELDCPFQRDLCPVCWIGEGVVGIAHVYREQPARDPELRGAISQRRGDCNGICRVDGERSGEQGEQGDAGGNFKTPVEWPTLFTCHSNPEKPLYACQTATRHV